MITGENQEVANAENHEMTTSENQEHEAATSVVGTSLRSGFSNSSLSAGTINIHYFFCFLTWCYDILYSNVRSMLH